MPSRIVRVAEEGACYHVTSATAGRRPIFLNASNARILLNAIEFVRKDRADVLAYAIMPDHLHVVLKPMGDYTLSQVMHAIKGYSSRTINRTRGRLGPIWQQSFFDRAIRDEEQLRAAVEYVEWNPVAAGLVATPEVYEFSSANPSWSSDLERYANPELERG